MDRCGGDRPQDPLHHGPLDPRWALPQDLPQWNLDLMKEGNSFLTELPLGWTAQWHENHIPKWIYVLRGSWSVESMDGQKLVFGPGEFSRYV